MPMHIGQDPTDENIIDLTTSADSDNSQGQGNKCSLEANSSGGVMVICSRSGPEDRSGRDSVGLSHHPDILESANNEANPSFGALSGTIDDAENDPYQTQNQNLKNPNSPMSNLSQNTSSSSLASQESPAGGILKFHATPLHSTTIYFKGH